MDPQILAKQYGITVQEVNQIQMGKSAAQKLTAPRKKRLDYRAFAAKSHKHSPKAMHKLK